MMKEATANYQYLIPYNITHLAHVIPFAEFNNMGLNN